MKLTAEGNLGIGISNPQARLDVYGMIRTSGGFIFPDGSVQTTAARPYSQPDGVTDNRGFNSAKNRRPGKGGFVPLSSGPINGMGTANQIAMFTGANDIGDSVITQSGSNIGISTSSPASTLHIGVAPSASANFGTLSLGSGAFDGSTSGFFAGSSSGTSVAVNETSGYGGNLMDLQVGGTRKLAVNANGSLGVQGTAPDSNVGVKLSRTGAIASATGVDASLITSLSSSNLFGGHFSAQSSTSGGLPDHPFTVGLSGQGSYTGSGRLDFSEGTESVVFNSGSGIIQDAYGTFNQVFNSGSGTIGAAYGSFNDVVNISTSNTIANASAFLGKVRNFNAGGITTAYGLNLSGWSKGSGTIGTSYGIYMDNSIDIGTTKFALYSSSASNSYFAGQVGVGTTTPTARLSVESTGSGDILSVNSSASDPFLRVVQDGMGRGHITIGDVNGVGQNTLFTLYDTGFSGAGVMELIAPTGTIEIGDKGLGNSTLLTVNDRDKLFFFDNGNVGIGTHSPTAALHVVGDFIATGTKSAVVPVSNKRMVTLYAVESPENWFEDFGTGKLMKGVAQIDLDPTFIQTVNTGMDYHVFLTPNGNCRGLYVAEKTATGFRVRELRGGKSNAAFDYRIVARRKGYEGLRLPELPISAPKNEGHESTTSKPNSNQPE